MEHLFADRQLPRIAFSSEQVAQIRVSGFLPAFYNKATMTAEISRFTSGGPAPIHLLDSVPADWVARRCTSGKILALKETVIAGYLYNGFFFTPEEVAHTIGL